MYTHTVRRQEGGEVVETRTNVSRHIYDQLLSQVIMQLTVYRQVWTEKVAYFTSKVEAFWF